MSMADGTAAIIHTFEVGQYLVKLKLSASLNSKYPGGRSKVQVLGKRGLLQQRTVRGGRWQNDGRVEDFKSGP